MARLYANECFPVPVVELLRALGHDVLTTWEAGQANQAVSDAQVVAFAVGQQRAVITLNRRHFVQLHRRSSNHEGIIVCTNDQAAPLAERIHAALSLDSLRGQLVKVNRE